MADDITLSSNIGSGAVLATDEITSKHYQKILIGQGADGTWTRVTAGAGLTVELEVGGQALQLDDTDKLAVSIYGKASAAGDKEVLVDAAGHLQIDVLSIATGNNNIGNVDIVTLPSGNLGQQAMAASLSVVPASNITDATYIGDIKFGEALPAGTNNIGDMDVLSVIPGTGATNLGKAIDSAAGATDTGIAMLGKHVGDSTHITTADGDYELVHVSDFGAMQSSPEQHHTFDNMDAVGNWIVVNGDTINVTTTKKHVLGTDALSFDKDNTGANSVFAMIQNTISPIDLGDISPHDLIQTTCYLSSLANVSYVFVRIGTDISNYNEWRVDVADLTAATFETLALSVGDPSYDGITGDGWNPSAITWIAVGVVFDAETRTLAGIVFDEVSFHTNQHSSASLNSEVSSSVSSSNINIHKVGNKVVNTQGGTIGTGTQRITIATDDTIGGSVYVDGAAWNNGASKNMLAGGVYHTTFPSSADGTTAPFQMTVDGKQMIAGSHYERVAHVTDDPGVAVLSVRKDDVTDLAGADGDYTPLQVDNRGALYVNPAAAEPQRNSGVAVGGAPGTDDIIAAVGGKKLLITGLALFATSETVNNVFIDNVDNDLIGNTGNPIPLSTDADGNTVAGFVLPFNPHGWFKTDTINEAVTLNSSAAQDIIWSVSWIETD